VSHPLVAAVAFTGSQRGGLALLRLASARPRPIPVFAEMGSVNPVVVLPGVLERRSTEIAAGLHASFTLGVGQLCTNPGVALVPEGSRGDAFAADLAERTAKTPAGAMLCKRILRDYEDGLRGLAELGAVRLAIGLEAQDGARARAVLWQASIEQALSEPRLLAEIFGPCTLLVRYRSDDELVRFADSMDGQLTASVHGDDDDLAPRADLFARLASRVGRLVFNQFPTGVQVTGAIVHGGPFPASSDARTTSVGARAIERFTRLVSFQNAPDGLLPPALRNANPLGISRIINGTNTTRPLE
jgi:NADP-dependent aldehyde dehydrogenase